MFTEQLVSASGMHHGHRGWRAGTGHGGDAHLPRQMELPDRAQASHSLGTRHNGASVRAKKHRDVDAGRDFISEPPPHAG